jgi:AbrB family transcriptional regulator, transcriptional pleiotropic regulator of transition state genes
MLKFTGITRKLDHLGRICIPKELRRTLGFKENQPVEIQVSGNRMIVQKEKENENSFGVVRCIDSLGRIVFPIEARRTLRLEENDSLEVMVDEDRIVFQKYQPGCVVCSSVNELRTIGGKLVCGACVAEIREGA